MKITIKSLLRSCFLIGALVHMGSCVKNNLSSNEKELDNDRKKTVQSKKLEVSPAFKNIDVAYQQFGVNPAKGEKIEIKKSGTVIEIPANAFVDENGNPIKEKVDISFREFHDAAEIIASGIPMHNPETGEYMESAGMFEIKGHCKGKEVYIAPDKKIQVNLASYNKGNQFDFFKLDKNGRWETKQENGEATINLKKVEELKKVNKKKIEKPVQPTKLENNNNFVFEIDVNYKTFPELGAFKEVLWQFDEKDVSVYNNERKKEIFESDWSNIDIKREKDNFKLILKNGKKKVEISVVPVLKGKDYTNAKKEFDLKMKEFEKIQKEMETIRAMYEQQAELQRSYQISGFGIYNWDIWKEDATMNLEAKVDFDKEFDYAEKMPNVGFFLVNSNRKAVVRYNLNDKGRISNFRFPSNNKNTLIAVLPGNKVAIFKDEDFKALNKFKNGDAVTLKMKTEKIEINSVEDISKLIAMY